MNQILIIGVAITVFLIVVGIIFARLYKRTSKGMAFVRTGMGGSKVCLDGGLLCLPVIHDTINVNMNTLRLDVSRSEQQALITKDRLRVDVTAEFYVRVKPDDESIATAAQTLGNKTLDPNALRQLTESKFTDSLRAVASSMGMEELHEKRSDFVQKVQQSVMEDLAKNGLELESVSLTGLDQTDIKYFNENNAFDAEGLTILTEKIEEKRKTRNEIEQTNRVAIEQRNLEAQQELLAIKREGEYSRLQQESEIAIRKAEQAAETASQEADRQRESDEAQIQAQRAVDLQRIDAEKQVEQQQILKKQQIQQAAIAQEKAVELAEQDKKIAISQKSEEESEASRKANEARIGAVQAEEQVITVRDTEIANRNKAIEIIDATKEAEKGAVGIQVQSRVELEAAENLSKAKIIQANATKDAALIIADGQERTYAVEADGKRLINEAMNTLNDSQISMAVKMELIGKLQGIITASAKPMENIDSIKIVQMNGQPFGAGAAGVVGTAPESLAEQFVNAGLKYRACAPLVDNLMSEVGLNGAELSGLYNPKGILSPEPTATAESTANAEPAVSSAKVDGFDAVIDSSLQQPMTHYANGSQEN